MWLDEMLPAKPGAVHDWAVRPDWFPALAEERVEGSNSDSSANGEAVASRLAALNPELRVHRQLYKPMSPPPCGLEPHLHQHLPPWFPWWHHCWNPLPLHLLQVLGKPFTSYSLPFIEDKEEEWNHFWEMGCPASYTEVGSSPPPRSRSASPRTSSLVAVEHTPPEGQDRRTSAAHGQWLLTSSAFCIFLSGRSTPEISSPHAVKGILKPQRPWPSSCEYTGDLRPVWKCLLSHGCFQCWKGSPVIFSFSGCFESPLVCEFLIESVYTVHTAHSSSERGVGMAALSLAEGTPGR